MGEKTEKAWNKFHALLGSGLKVGFETTFLRAVVLDLNPLYEERGLIHDRPNETVKRISEPAAKILSCQNDDAIQIFFEPVLPANSLYRQLIFTRKTRNHWMVAARHGEVSHFGFDSWNSKSLRYLALAYPGLSKNFVPVYFKIQMEGGDFVFLEIWAWDEDSQVVVQGRKVDRKEAPEHLIFAQP